MKLTKKDIAFLESQGATVSKKKLRGERKQRIFLVLRYPPTTNHLYCTVRGRRVLSAQAKAYKRSVDLACQQQNSGHVVGEIALKMYVYPPDNRRRDLSNVIKITEDSLTEAGVWEDDSQISSIEIYRGRVANFEGSGQVNVEIKEQPWQVN